MLAVTLFQAAVIVVTATVVVACAAYAIMEARRLQNADQYRFAAQVSRRAGPAPVSGELVQADTSSRISLIVDRLVDSMSDMPVEAVRTELSLAS